MAEDKQENKAVKVYEKPGLTWVNIASPSPEALAEVKSRFPFFHDFDLRDCLPPFQRPKLIKRGQYLFMVLLFPVFNKETGKIRQAELDMFIGKDFVVTNHFGELEPLGSLDACYRGEADYCPRERLDNAAVWVHNLLAELLSGCFPMLTHVANDLQALEKDLFEQEVDPQTVRDILRIKSNIVDFRRIMQGHKRVLERLMAESKEIMEMDGLSVFYEDLRGFTKEIWDFLENDKNTIDAVYDSYTSLVNYETSQATKALSALALIVFPATLTAAIFAMDADHMPIRGLFGDWWIMLGFVTFTAATVIYFLHKKKWL